MTILQLIMFAWVSTYVLADSLWPSMGHQDKLAAAFLSTVSTAYLSNAHGLLWRWMRKRLFRI